LVGSYSIYCVPVIFNIAEKYNEISVLIKISLCTAENISIKGVDEMISFYLIECPIKPGKKKGGFLIRPASIKRK